MLIKSNDSVYNTLILALTLNTEHYSAEFSFLFFSHRDYVFKHFTSVFSSRGGGGGGGGGYLAFEKYDLFIYFIVHNVDIFICYPWIFYSSA